MSRQPITIMLSEEAKAFIKAQPLKAQQKIYFNIFKVEGGVMDAELSRNWITPTSGNYGHCSMVSVTGFSLSGIKSLAHS